MSQNSEETNEKLNMCGHCWKEFDSLLEGLKHVKEVHHDAEKQ